MSGTSGRFIFNDVLDHIEWLYVYLEHFTADYFVNDSVRC